MSIVAESPTNKLIVFFATGLWHGASWNFVIWGMIHGAGIVIEDIAGRLTGKQSGEKLKDASHKQKSGFGSVLGWIYTMLVVVLAFVLFRADTLSGGMLMLREMFTGFNGSLTSYNLCMKVLNPYNITMFAIACFCSLPHPKLSSMLHEHRTISYILTMVLFVLSILEIAGASFNPFIYFRF